MIELLEQGDLFFGVVKKMELDIAMDEAAKLDADEADELAALVDVFEEFEGVGDETRVSVEHRGFDQVPAESAARHGFPDQALLMRLAEWWQVLLGSLRDRSA